MIEAPRDSTDAVLLLAYGTPETLADIEAYFTHIRGGRAPTLDSLAALQRRYEMVGGSTPLLDITRETAANLEAALNRSRRSTGQNRRVYVGMKHWHPYIADTMQRMMDEGVERVTAVVLAPHYSRMSVGAYRKLVEDAAAELSSDREFEITFVERWFDEPAFVAMLAQLVLSGLEKFPQRDRDGVVVVFSAHSLPVRIRQWEDPYERELLESSAMVARAVGLTEWRFAWQSAGETGEPWLGPDILEYLEQLHAEGVRNILQVPIGFVSEHLEILWDIDREATERAAQLGMVLHRTELPNASDALVNVLAEVIARAEAAREQRATAPV